MCPSRGRGWSAATTDCRTISGPVVVKAPDRQGQKGLTLVESPDGLGPAIEVARSAARNGLALVEELVDGPEVTVVGFSVDGVFTALTVTDRITAAPPAFGVALAHVWPSHVRGLTPDVAERAVAALGIRTARPTPSSASAPTGRW